MFAIFNHLFSCQKNPYFDKGKKFVILLQLKNVSNSIKWGKNSEVENFQPLNFCVLNISKNKKIKSWPH
jgi:hypothetical protein